MHLYELTSGQRFRLCLEGATFADEELVFDHLDGMYSYCINGDRKVVHIAANSEVIVVE